MTPDEKGPSGVDESTDIFSNETPGEEEFPCLQQISSPGRGARYKLYPGKNIIGRSEDADVSLDDSSVSREHAELDVREGGAIARDLGSRNGTVVEGEKITADAPITHNQRIKVGSYDFQYLTQPEPLAEEVEEAVEPAPAEAPEQAPPAETEAPEGAGEVDQAVQVSEAQLPATIPEGELPAVPEAGGRFASLKQIPTKWWLAIGGILGILLFGYLSYRVISAWLTDETAMPPEVQRGTLEDGEPKVLPDTAPVEQPEYIPVFLEFKSTPIAAQVFFGDESVGTTPFKMSAHLHYGKVYEVKAIFRLEEMGETLERKLRFSLGADQQVIPVKFEAPIGHLKIASLPREVDLYLEGSFTHDPHRAKPIKFNEIIFGKPIYLPFGDYHVELKQSRRLGSSKTFINEVIYGREFKIDKESPDYEIAVRDRDLKIFPISIVTTPEGADCLVDGEKLGTTPFESELEIGEHTLILRKEGYFEHKQPIRVDLNTPFIAEIELKTSEAGRLINEARVRIKQKRYAEAIDHLVNALRENPTKQELAESHYLIGQSYLYQGKYEDARDHFMQGMRHEFFRYASRLGIAQISFNQGERIRALQVLVEVLIQAKRGEVRSEAASLFQQISAFKSAMYLTTKPEGAKVTVNGRDVKQTSPLILHDLMTGIYRLQFSLPGYQSESMKVDLGVSEFKPIIVELKPVATQ